MAKTQKLDTFALDDCGVTFEDIIWLRGAGLSNGDYSTSFETFVAALEVMKEMPITKELPVLAQFLLDDEIDPDALAAALQGRSGFILRMHVPKRRWFSDGSVRSHSSEGWRCWTYLADVSQFAEAGVKFAESMAECDAQEFPRLVIKQAA